MSPPGRTPPEKPPAAERHAPPQPWRSPWSLDDEWDHWPVQHPALRQSRAELQPSHSLRTSLAASPAPAAAAGSITTHAVAKPLATIISPKPPTKPLASTASPTPPSPPPTREAASSPSTASPARQRLATPSWKPPPPPRSVSSWFSAIILSLGLLGFTVLAWIYLQDSPPESDEDLRIALPVDQTPITTAPQRLQSFLNSVVPLKDRRLGEKPATQWDTPSLASFVTANGVAFDNLRDLLEDADWHPRHSNWHTEDLGAHPAWLDLSVLFQAQAAYLMRRGDEESAFTTAVDLAELSRRLQDLWTWPSFQARSQDLHISAVQTMAELLKYTRLGSERLHSFQEEFARCEPSDEELKGALNAYYVHEKKILLGPSSGEPLDTMPNGLKHERPGRLFFKVNQTLSLFATAFRELKAEVAAAPYAAFNITGEKLRRTRQTSPQFYQPNATGEKYFSDRIGPYLSLPETHSLARARHGLVMTFFALRRYAADHQRLPPSLAELRPAYLTEIPIDPFSGEPFHFDHKQGLLFSVGTNLISEGGKPTQPPLGDDREPTVYLGLSAR